jgi:peptidoglycan hydrolase-like protein with peptidoglycan-binding domain
LVNQLSGVVTAIGTEGTVVKQGQVLYYVNNTPVVLMYGAIPAWRSLSNGVSGPDVRQFEENLIALGDRSLIADGNFTIDDANSVRRWQQSLGLPRTGIVELGRVAVLPGPVRIDSHAIAVGSTISVGTQPIAITSENRVVLAQIDVVVSRQLHVGQAVELTFSDGKTGTGSIAKIATPAADRQTAGSSPNSAATSTTIVIAGNLPPFNDASVTVGIALQTVRGVLAVPITALVALAEGGYGVEILDSADRRRLVAAQTGLFDEMANLVEISGPDLAEGVRVVVPTDA